MTLSSETVKVSYSGNGATTAFPITFDYWDDEDILAVLRSSAGAETTWVDGTNYTLTGGGGSTGTLTATTAPATGETLVIKSNRAETQENSFPLGGPFPSTSAERAFDQTTRLIQQHGEELDRTLKFPITDPAASIGEIPAVSDRKGKVLGFNSSTGAPEAIETDDISSTAVTVTGSTASRTLANRFRDVLSVLDFGAVGDGTTNDTTAIQLALDTAWAANLNVHIPAGVYKTTGLTLPGNAAGRTKAFRMYGQGSGEIFARPFTGGTILYSVTNAPVLIYTPDVANTGGGNIDIDHIRFEGNSTTPVVHLKSFYAQSNFHHNTIYQAGTGNGLQVELSNGIEIHNNYAINRDWNTTGLGAARVGVGFKIFQTIPTGLTTLRKNSSRGFKDAYVIGDGVTAMYSASISECECSVVYNGITIQAGADKALVLHNYFEGGDGGYGVYILGNYCTTNDNLIFPGFSKGIYDVSLTNYGSYGTGNILSAGSVAGTTLLDIRDGGFGKTYTGNALVFGGSGGSIANVIAVNLAGADAKIYYAGNIYNPITTWSGGSGTIRIIDSTTAAGASGTSPFVIGDLVSGQPTVYHTGGMTPPTATTGTDTAPSVTESYYAEVRIPENCTLTGIAILNGSAAAGNVKASLVDGSTGLQLATTASTAQAGTAAFQKIAFTALYAAKGPAKYLIHLQFSNTGARFRSHAVGVFGASKKTAETYGTFTTVTFPTTFTADLGPIAAVY